MPELPRLVLASASPRRRHLLKTLGLPFIVLPSRLEELSRPGESAPRRAVRLAREKAEQVAVRLRRPSWVLGADTLVVVQGQILEKPADDAAAAGMLKLLSGQRHRVITGLCLLPCGLSGAAAWSDWSSSQVTFAPLDQKCIRWLMASGEHRDKAGAYGVQGRAAAYITSVTGSPSNVIGLPLDLLSRALAGRGYLPAAAITRLRN
jgi:septum formation protein